MSDIPPEEDVTSEEPRVETRSIDVQEIEVPVQFEIGRATATLGQLQSMQSGYVFELAEKVDEPVIIQVHGTPVGRGELVHIGDRIGVRVTKVIQNGNSNTT